MKEKSLDVGLGNRLKNLPEVKRIEKKMRGFVVPTIMFLALLFCSMSAVGASHTFAWESVGDDTYVLVVPPDDSGYVYINAELTITRLDGCVETALTKNGDFPQEEGDTPTLYAILWFTSPDCEGEIEVKMPPGILPYTPTFDSASSEE